MGIDILGVDILGIDILGIDILALPRRGDRGWFGLGACSACGYI